MGRAFPLKSIPAQLRKPLLSEYQSIIQNYFEHRWGASELSAGRFCEIVYTIVKGYGAGVYPDKPSKPRDFVTACRGLESAANVPRSFQILIPRLLPALYEIRNNRGVGHVGGDVDPNHMDSTVAIGMCNWIMAELVRVLHDLPTEKAQQLVDSIAEYRIPLVWDNGNIRRVLEPGMSLKNQILALLASSPDPVSTSNLLRWLDYKNQNYFLKLLRSMHDERLVEFSAESLTVEILPQGSKQVASLVLEHRQAAV